MKIYATDVDEEALARARQAVYDAREVEGVPAELLEKYFEPVNDRYAFHKDLRRSVIFGRHDLIQDAPISRIDLLACRNTLMYFNTETQARILDRFHFALNDRGFLFLGKAETLLTYNNTFVPVDLKRRIFAKVAAGQPPRPAARRWPAPAARRRSTTWSATSGSARSPSTPARWPSSSSTSAACWPWPTSGPGPCSASPPADLGRPLQDLQISYRPADLRSCIDRAYAERRPVVLEEVEWSPGAGEAGYLDVHVVPLIDPGGPLLGASITFLDVTVDQPAPGRAPDARTASWRPPTRSSSRPTRSWRPPTRSSSPPSRSWRPPTRSSSRPTRSWRR